MLCGAVGLRQVSQGEYHQGLGAKRALQKVNILVNIIFGLLMDLEMPGCYERHIVKCFV